MSCKFSLHMLNVRQIIWCVTFISFCSRGIRPLQAPFASAPSGWRQLWLLLRCPFFGGFVCFSLEFWQIWFCTKESANINKSRKARIHSYVHSDFSVWISSRKQRPVDDSTFRLISQKNKDAIDATENSLWATKEWVEYLQSLIPTGVSDTKTGQK